MSDSSVTRSASEGRRGSARVRLLAAGVLVVFGLGARAVEGHLLINAGGDLYVPTAGEPEFGDDPFDADKAWVAGDFGYVGGVAMTYASEVTGTADDLLYQTMRQGTSFSYLFQPANVGNYELRIYFTEPTATAVGERVFDILVDGAVVVDDFDLFAVSGGSLVAHQQVLTVTVLDGRVDIGFSAEVGEAIVSAISVAEMTPLDPSVGAAPYSVDFGKVSLAQVGSRTVTLLNDGQSTLTVSDLATTNAVFSVSGPAVPFDMAPATTQDLTVEFSPAMVELEAGDLEITRNDPVRPVLAVPLAGEGVDTPAGAAFRLNSGGVDFTDANGDLFLADRAWVAGDFGYVGGEGVLFANEIAGTTDDPLYQNVRGGSSFSYLFDNLSAGDYELTLYFIEPVKNNVGQRQFDVTVEGVVALDNFDIFAAAGGKNTAHAETLVTTVADGQLNIDFTPVVGNNVLVSAVAVVGLAPAPDIAVSPAALDFGSVPVGTDSDLVVAVSNAGDADLEVTDLATTSASFTVISPATPFTVGVGAAGVDVTVRFSPALAGPASGDLEITSNDPDEGLLAVALSGVGALDEPDIRVDPASLDFGDVVLGSDSDMVVTVINDGTQLLTVSDLSTTNGVFTVVSPVVPFDVGASGGTQDVTVRFSPVVVGVEVGDLEITSNDPDEGLVTVALTGEGIDEPPAVEMRITAGGDADFTDSNGDLFVADRAYVAGDFGYVGGTVSVLSKEITGTTDDALYQSMRAASSFSYLFDGLGAGDYLVTLYFTEPAKNSAGQRMFDVTLEGVVALDDFDIVAASGGKFVAHQEALTATVTDGQLNIDFTVVVGGRALVSAIAVESLAPLPEEPDIRVDPATVDFGAVVVGEMSDRTVTVFNDGTQTLTVSDLFIANPAFAVVGPATPFDVGPSGGSAVVTVRFSPLAFGVEAGDLEITSNDPDEGLVTVALSGEGVDTPPALALRITAGGSEDYTDSNGDLFVADKAYVVGDFGYVGGSSSVLGTGISGTTDDALYQSMRAAPSFSYQFDNLLFGDYSITLYFTEPAKNAAGQRQFDVIVEGVVVLDNLDVFAASGGKFVAYTETVIATVSDGQLNIDFDSVVGGKALVSAIAVESLVPVPDEPDISVDPDSVTFGLVLVGGWRDRSVTITNAGAQTLTVSDLQTTNPVFSVVAPAAPFDVAPVGGTMEVTLRFSPTMLGAEAGDLQITSNDPDEPVATVALSGEGVDSIPEVALRMNSGGPDYVDTNGDLFEADRAYVAGDLGFVGGSTVSRVEAVTGDNDELYQQFRDGASFSYVFDNIPEGDYEVRLYFAEFVVARGERIFDVTIEGQVELDNFDVMLAAKDLFEAYRETVTVTVSDGQLNVDFNLVSGGSAILSAIAVVNAPQPPLASYVDVAGDVGIILDHTRLPDECEPYQPGFGATEIGTGSCWADYDSDGDVDLYVTNNGADNRLYRNDGDSSGDGLPDFTNVAAVSGVDDPTGVGHSCVFVDYDNDGDQDLYVTNWKDPNVPGAPGNSLYQNQLSESGSATFLDVAVSAGVEDDGRGITTAWGDFDQDGDLDFYITKHFTCMPTIPNQEDTLYRNNGDGTFSDVTGFLCPGGVAPCAATSGLGFAPGWVDYDNDGDLDLYLVNDDIANGWSPNVLWRNDGDDGLGGWTFTDVSAASETNQSENGMGLAIGDYLNEGLMAFGFSNQSPNNLLRQRGDGSFEDVSALAGIQRGRIDNAGKQWTWGSVFFDHDSDGWLDLLFVAGVLDVDNSPADEFVQPNAFFWNNRDGTFTDLTESSGLGHPGRGRNAATVDFDEDGWVDLFIANMGEPPLLLRNQAADLGNPNHWLTVTAEGTTSNRDAIGTRMWLTTPDGITQMREISSGSTHGGGDYRAAYFGLGDNLSGDLTVRWPDGTIEVIGTVAADQALHLVEP